MTTSDALPVYTDPVEFSQLLAILHTLAPRECLEWGSGGGTKAILDHCPFVRRYVSIEHDRAWYEKVRSYVHDPRLELHHVPADKPLPPGKHTRQARIAWDASAETDASVMESYVAFPRSLGLACDFVLVDGRARCFCLATGFELLRPGGVIAIHDAQRPQYRDAIERLGTPLFLEPWKQGQLCLVRKERADGAE